MRHIIDLAVFGFFEVVLPVALATVVALSPVAAQDVGHLLWQRHYGAGEKWFKATGIVLSAQDCIKLKMQKDRDYGSVVQSACVRVGDDPETAVKGR